MSDMPLKTKRWNAPAERLDCGENVTLLCSKDCFLPEACHRTELAKLVLAACKVSGNAAGETAC